MKYLWFLIALVLSTFSASARECYDAYDSYQNDNLDVFHNVYTGRLERRCRYYSVKLLDRFGRNGNFRLTNAYYEEVLRDASHIDRDLLKKFTEYCLPSYKDTSFSSFSDYVAKLVKNIVVILRQDDDDFLLPICTGILLPHGVLTARHCYIQGLASELVTTKDGKCKAFRISDISGYRYFHVGTGKFLEVEQSHARVPSLYKKHPNVICKKSYLNKKLDFNVAQSDWAYLRTSSQPLDVEFVWNSKDEFQILDDTQYLFIGFSKLKYLMNITNGTNSDVQSAVEDSIYIDIGFICKPFYRKLNLFFHGCSTMSVTSGSPIFEFNNDVPIREWKFYGLNTGTSAFLETCSLNDLELLTPEDGNLVNGGVSIPFDVFDK